MNNKKWFYKLILFFISTICINTNIYADENQIVKQQIEALGIPEFIKEADKYSEDVLGNIRISDVMTDAIQGKVDNSTIFKRILTLFR